MVEPQGAENTLKHTLFLKGSVATRKKMGRRQLSPYKLALVAHDILITGLALGLGALIIGLSFFMKESPAQFGSLFVVSFMIIAFFPTYNLYNYHLIFSGNGHLRRLCKSFFWSLLSIGIVFFLYRWEGLFEETLLVMVVFLVAIGLMLFRGLLLDKTLNLIKSVGLSFVAIGTISLISGDEKPIVMTNW